MSMNYQEEWKHVKSSNEGKVEISIEDYKKLKILEENYQLHEHLEDLKKKLKAEEEYFYEMKSQYEDGLFYCKPLDSNYYSDRGRYKFISKDDFVLTVKTSLTDEINRDISKLSIFKFISWRREQRRKNKWNSDM